MKTSESLNDILKGKAEEELLQKLKLFFEPIEKFAYTGLHSGAMDHAPKESVSGGSYFTVVKDVWPPHLVQETKDALFEGMKRDHTNKYISNFISKVDSLGEQIEALQQEIQQ